MISYGSEMGEHPGRPRWAQCNREALIIKQGGQSRRCNSGAEAGAVPFEGGGGATRGRTVRMLHTSEPQVV